MHRLAGGLALVAGLLLGQAPAPAGKADEAAVKRLVLLLGSRKYAEREAAGRQLEALGEAALPALRRAARGTDLETSRRAGLLVVRIEDRLEVARLLTGTRVRLTFKDTPVLDAVEEVAARTGFHLQVEGDTAALEARTVSLDTGLTTAWEALAQFCRKAGLTEGPPPGSLPGDGLSLADGRAAGPPTYLAGSVRVRALPARGKEEARQGFVLEALPAPGVAWQGVVGVRLTRAVNERGEELIRPALPPAEAGVPQPGPDRPAVWDALSGRPAAGAQGRREVAVWLPAGKQPAARLREVRGFVSVQVSTVRELLSVDLTQLAQGKEFTDANGRSLKVLKFARDNESLTLEVQVKAQSGAGGGAFHVVRDRKGVLVMRGGRRDAVVGLALQDSAGTTWQPEANRQGYLPSPAGGGLLANAAVRFRLKPGQLAPVRLICSGPRPLVIDLPFTLRGVPLSPPAPAADRLVPER
jgi:hypothetical protein